MMPIRKQTLEEWFLAYQLQHVKRAHFHLPFQVNVDVTGHCQNPSHKISWTSVVIRAAGLALKKNPRANRAVFKTFYGMRVYEPDHASVNVAVNIQNGTDRHLVGIVVKNSDTKSVEAIKAEIKVASQRKVSETKIGRYVFGKKNHFFNRLRLKLIHFAAQNIPQLYEKFGGGGVSVSSLLNCGDGSTDLSIYAHANTAMTIGIGSVYRDPIQGRSFLRLGISYDHFACSGEDAAKFCHSLSEILQNFQFESDHRPQLKRGTSLGNVQVRPDTFQSW